MKYLKKSTWIKNTKLNQLYFKLNSIDGPSNVDSVHISSWPINCIENILVNDTFYLWLASKNRVYVLDEKRLVNVAKFKASSNQYDHVYLIKSSDYGIWLSLIGSSLIYLYDHINYEFKFIFNPKLNQIEHSMMEEEYNFNFGFFNFFREEKQRTHKLHQKPQCKAINLHMFFL